MQLAEFKTYHEKRFQICKAINNHWQITKKKCYWTSCFPDFKHTWIIIHPIFICWPKCWKNYHNHHKLLLSPLIIVKHCWLKARWRLCEPAGPNGSLEYAVVSTRKLCHWNPPYNNGFIFRCISFSPTKRRMWHPLVWNTTTNTTFPESPLHTSTSQTSTSMTLFCGATNIIVYSTAIFFVSTTHIYVGFMISSFDIQLYCLPVVRTIVNMKESLTDRSDQYQSKYLTIRWYGIMMVQFQKNLFSGVAL